MDTHAQKNTEQGFTLIEFIVIMIIFSIMASVSLFNFTGFRNETMLSNLAHDLALTIRQVQVAGSSAVGDAGAARGIFFEYDSDGFSNTFIIFNDTNNTGLYDVGSDTIVNELTIASEDRITILDDNDTPINQDLSIVFRRPNPTAYMSTALSSDLQGITIRIASQNDTDRSKDIIIRRSGFIYVVE